MKEEKRILQLDGLRFFAVLMVMIAHWLIWKMTNPIIVNIPFTHGVTLFFVLSGFLITRILLAKKDELVKTNTSRKYLIKNFYIRRFLRIFPIYYLLLAILFTIDYRNTRELFPWLVSYSTNIYQSIHNESVGSFNHFWSLGVEEQFYLFWPFLILFIKPKRIFSTILIVIISAILLKTYFYLYLGSWRATTYFTLNCMHALGIGALLSYFTLYNKQFVKMLGKPIWLYLGIFLYLIMLYINFKYKFGWYKEVGDEVLFAIVSALVILRASNNGFKWGLKYILENKFVTYSGKISYGLYVYHLFIPALYYAIAPKIGLALTNKYILFITFYFITMLVAHFSWLLIERPLNSLKSKVPYVKQDILVASVHN